jgi:hypothetical protein
MSTDDQLEQLRQDVRYLQDRLAILDCVNRQSRGQDRHDAELMASAYHDDGIDEHGPIVNSGAEYGEWINQAHTSGYTGHLHNLTTHTCEIDGDEAHCESYFMASMVGSDGTSISLICGRYLDRLERRKSAWRIAVRRCTIEWVLLGDGSLLPSGAFQGFVKGTWDQSDLSYARPMQFETSAARW